MLGFGVLDAFIAGLSTAFFGSLVAGGAYLLKQQLSLREQVGALAHELRQLSQAEGFLDSYGTARVARERLNRLRSESGGDEPA